MRFTVIFMAPKLAKLLGVRLNAESVDYFNEFSTKIIADKRKSYLKGSGAHGKATNFIELMLEAEVEEGGSFAALQGGEKDKLKCKFYFKHYFFIYKFSI